MKVFLDTNVIVDVLAAREPFYRDSQSVVSYCEHHRGAGCLSALTFCTAAYVLRKYLGKESLPEKMRQLRQVFHVPPVTEATVDWAIDAGLSDFEDAMQYESAKSGATDVIVTRDKTGFISSEIPVLTPSEFCQEHVS